MEELKNCCFKTDNSKKYDKGDPTDLFRLDNIALVFCYFCVGMTGSLLSTPLNVYLVEVLHAEPAMQNTIIILQTLPWSFKIIFGFLSDAVPIFGMHRKPYLVCGCLLYSLAYVTYALYGLEDLIMLAACIFAGTIGLVQLDVMADTLCVERSKFEPDDIKGQMQASCYSIRFGGGLLGAVLGATVCNKEQWGWGLEFRQVAFIVGLVPLILITPWLYFLKEKYEKRHKNIQMSPQIRRLSFRNSERANNYKLEMIDEKTPILSSESITNNNNKNYSQTFKKQAMYTKPVIIDEEQQELHDFPIGPPKLNKRFSFFEGFNNFETLMISKQIQEIWQTVQLKAVWRPMAFVYIYNICQIPNVSWQSYLQLSLHFEPWILGLTVTLGSFMSFAGILAYKYYFFNVAWKNIYVWSLCLTTFFALMQLCLIFQINTTVFHISNYFFSLGDDVITAYISGIQFLPVCIMYMRLCPDGAEGSSYSMLTTFGNIALVCAANIGNILSSVWDVSNHAMECNDINGLWRLTLLTSSLALVPLAFLSLLPQNVDEQDDLAKSKERSVLGGVCFLLVLFGSLTWTISSSIMRLASIHG